MIKSINNAKSNEVWYRCLNHEIKLDWIKININVGFNK